MENATQDNVRHPSHYTAYGAEVIEITKYMSFCRGNVVKYCCRAGLKNKATELEDLLKAKQYLEWEIELVQKRQEPPVKSQPKGD